MGAVVCCPSCGHVHQVILSDAEYAARFPGNGVAGQRPPAAAAPAPAPLASLQLQQLRPARPAATALASGRGSSSRSNAATAMRRFAAAAGRNR